MANATGKKYVHAYKDHTGVQRHYFRRGRVRVRLPGLPGTPEFERAYADAQVARPVPPKMDGPNAVRAVMAQALRRAEGRARERGMTVSIDIEWVMAKLAQQRDRCALSGIKFSIRHDSAVTGWKKNPYAPSLDRIDCRKGYEPDNVRIVLAAVNFALNEWGEDTLRKIAAGLVRRSPGTSEPEE